MGLRPPGASKVSENKNKSFFFFRVIHLLLVGDIFQCGVTWRKYKTTQPEPERLTGLGETALIRMKVEKCGFLFFFFFCGVCELAPN